MQTTPNGTSPQSQVSSHYVQSNVDAVIGIGDSLRVRSESLVDVGRIELPTPWLQTPAGHS